MRALIRIKCGCHEDHVSLSMNFPPLGHSDPMFKEAAHPRNFLYRVTKKFRGGNRTH